MEEGLPAGDSLKLHRATHSQAALIMDAASASKGHEKFKPPLLV